MKIPTAETIRLSAISHLRETGSNDAAELLSNCKIEISNKAQKYIGSTTLGLNVTIRCKAVDLSRFEDPTSMWDLPSEEHILVQNAISAVLPTELKLHDLSARSILVDRNEYEKTEIEQIIEAQKALMIAVATGGPRIQEKGNEYKTRRKLIREKLGALGKTDPNPHEDLWAWYGKWSSGDLPKYQLRRDYIADLYRPLLEELVGAESTNPSEPNRDPTGWEKVDRIIDQIVNQLSVAKLEEAFQAIGLLCRECLISLAQEVYREDKHIPNDGQTPSKTDAYRMLEAYFSSEYSGPKNEVLRRHAKAALNLANQLQHKRTADYREAALCSEATRTVVNIVAITSGIR